MASSKTDSSSSAWKFFLALALITVVFIAMYVLKSPEQQGFSYNGFEFQQSGEGFWVTEVQSPSGQQYFIPFHHHPSEVEDVIVHEDVRDILFGEKPSQLFISIDPDAGSRPVVAGVEISRITGNRYDLLNIPTSSALSRPADKAVDTPVVNCNNASAIPNSTVVVQFVHDPEANAIVRDQQCLVLFYKTPEDSIRVADRLAYMMLQIMK